MGAVIIKSEEYPFGWKRAFAPQSNVPAEATKEPGLDSLRPVSGWIMYELTDDADKGADFERDWLRE